MDYAVVISAIVLGLSVLATTAKFLDWFVHSDPKTMVRTTRWMLLLVVLACIPLLVMTIANQQWPAAMLIGGWGRERQKFVVGPGPPDRVRDSEVVMSWARLDCSEIPKKSRRLTLSTPRSEMSWLSST